jgi:hypothetical protein
MQKLYGKLLNSTVNCRPDSALPNNFFQFCGIENLAKLFLTLATVAEFALQNRRKLPNILVEKWQKLTKRYDNSNKLKKIAAKMQTIVFLESYMFSIDNWYPSLNGEFKKALIFNTVWLKLHSS